MTVIQPVVGNRWDDIDRAKGLAIFLVVLGHAVARDMPVGAEWFAAVKWGVYGFHMAFFMFISGFVFFTSSQILRAHGDYGAYALNRISRFMPAYILFALIVWGAKTAAQNVAHVDNAASGIESLFDIFLRPTLSPVSFLWYIWVLMLFQLLSPPLLRIHPRALVWVCVSFPLLFIPAPYLFGFDKVFKFLFFFFVGGFVAQNTAAYLAFLGKAWLPLLLLFAACLALVDPKRYSILLGILSIPALHGLVRWGFMKNWKWLSVMGALSYSIYLMNTMAIGGTKAIVLKFSNWDGNNFFWVLPLLVAAGVLLPMLVKKLIFSRIPWLDRITS